MCVTGVGAGCAGDVNMNARDVTSHASEKVCVCVCLLPGLVSTY